MTQPSTQKLAIMGSTGSIGCSTLEVVALHPQRFQVHALCGGQNWELMLSQVLRFEPVFAILADHDSAEHLQRALQSHSPSTQVLSGSDAITAMASENVVDVVVAGIVGAAGLPSTLAAAKAGKRILLANKEALVMCGSLLMQMAAESGATLMPTDSEHNAIFQCLPIYPKEADSNALGGIDSMGIEKIVLTASGGPFRTLTKKQLSVVTRQQALKHPNWSMGPKISIDSATLMNKGLEVIEACYLFAVDPSLIEVLVHPESVIHSMVRYTDGSVIAQLGRPDMRTSITHCLSWPERLPSGVEPLDLVETGSLTFEKPDLDRFPCLRLAYEALAAGGTATTVLSAANETAVAAFLDDRVSFIQLPDIVEQTLEQTKIQTADDLDTILKADNTARQIAHTIVQTL